MDPRRLGMLLAGALVLSVSSCGDSGSGPAADVGGESGDVGATDAPDVEEPGADVLDADDAVEEPADDAVEEGAADVVEEPDATAPRDCFAPLAPPRWSTCQGGLYDPEGRRVRLRGVNVSNARKRPPYEGGTSPEEIAAMQSFGFNHVRLLWSWAAAMPEQGVLDTDYLDRYAAEVARFGEAGLLVLVDSHQDLFGEAIRTEAGPVGNGAPVWACPEEIASQFEEPLDPWFANYSQDAVKGCFDHLLGDEALQDEFAAAWGAMAARLAELDNVVGYDLWNEPFWGTHNLVDWEVELLVPLYERLGGAILAEDPDAVLFVEPGVQKNALGTSNLVRPDFPEVVYAPHLYDPAMESGEQWSGDTAWLSRRLGIDRGEAAALGAPVYIGEWGTPGSYESDAAFVVAVDDLLADVAVGWAIWQWGPGGPGTYALVDDTYALNPHAETLVRPWIARLAGVDSAVSWDAEAGVVEAEWTARSAGVGTVVIVPTALFEGEPTTVEVEGGTLVEGGESDRVVVVAAEVGGRVRVTVRAP